MQPTSVVRKDSPEAFYMENLIKQHRQLSELRIRNSAEMDRCEREIAQLTAEIKEMFEVETIEDLRALYLANQEANEAAMNAFGADLRNRQEKLAAIDEGN